MSAFLSANYNEYIGTKNFIRDTFPVSHKGVNIFKREFNGSNSDIVSVGSSTIFLPNHFFVSGEEVEYGYDLDKFHFPIGIALTTIPGIGLTDRLPSKVFIKKINDSYIQLSSTAENSLKTNANILNFTSLGIGTAHYLKSINPNNKVLISIDNIIQTPIISTASTTFLLNSLSFYSNILECENTKEFIVGDILKVNDEIMRVESVGFGNTNNLYVKRSFMGTEIQSHSGFSTVTKLSGSFNINEDVITFASAPYGTKPKVNPDDPSSIDYVGITTRSIFNGRVFIRSGVPDGSLETYTQNYIFDDVSSEFSGINTSFTLKVDGSNITDIFDKNFILLLNNVIQLPSRSNVDRNYILTDDGSKTELYIDNPKINQDNYDINSTGLPVGGRIVSIGSSAGSGYQPLKTAVIEAEILSGSISVVNIFDGGSGYRSNLQTVSVGILTDNSQVYPIGYANIADGAVNSVTIENTLSGLTEPPKLIIDAPVGYENIPLIYSQQSQNGIGTGAVVDIFISNNGSVRNFDLRNNGYGYKSGDILTIPTELENNIIGIPTDGVVPLNEFQVYVDQTYTDTFSAWSIGELQILDSPKKYFNGSRTVFPISIDGELKSIRAAKGSNVDIQSTLLVFYNDVLQNPGSGYIFNGGSVIKFPEAPNPDDKCEILFYRGTQDVDVIDVDILETIQTGDTIKINSDDKYLTENDRIVKQIISVDSLQTNNYQGPGILQDSIPLRPVVWCKTTEDTLVDGNVAAKSRISYEPLIYPTTNIIQNVGVGSTATIYVENVKTFFDAKNENLDFKFKSEIEIISQTENKVERLKNASYYGDFGKITSISPVFINPSQPALSLTLTIPSDSALLNSELVDNIPRSTSLVVGDYFTIKNSNIGYGITSVSIDGNQISTGTTFIDNVYQVASLESIGIEFNNTVIISGNVTYPSPIIISDTGTLIIDDGSELIVEIQTVTRVITRVLNHNNINVDIINSTSDYYGDYSWGKILAFKRPNPKSFETYTIDNSIGINSSPIVRRAYPLKYSNYLL